jgi:hypothetical protein
MHESAALPGPLREYALAALALFAAGDAGDAVELHFLKEHARTLGVDRATWRDALIASLQAPASDDEMLLRLTASLRLTPIELLAVVLAATVEEDAMAGRAVARLQAPVGGSRPTIGLVIAAFADALDAGPHPIDSIWAGAAARTGLLTIEADGGPLTERAVSVPLHVCQALHGSDGVLRGTRIASAGDERIVLPECFDAMSQRQAEVLVADPARALIVRTGSLAEARAIAAAVAREARLRALFIETEEAPGLGPWLQLRGLLPVHVFDLGPGDRRALPAIDGYAGPRIVLCGPDGTIDTGDATAVEWSVVVPSADERLVLWTRALGDVPLAADLARRRHGAGRIAQLGRLAQQHAALDGRAAPVVEDVAAAAWTLEGGGLGTLAQPIPDRIADDAFIAPAALAAELEALLLRCQMRDGLVDGLGASAVARYRPGVRALFVGPSGTGKTLAAAWLATRLGMPLFRVDLAAVTSKYIGETEKNLAQLLARAEQSEVVLLFDEADALFGKRTDVRDSNDRFANAQTNYLLQRIETFEGITLLTSNSRSRFDPSFARRLDAIIEFPLPAADERRALWNAHLGTRHTLDMREVNRLAARADLAGGHIRSVVLAAAALARQRNEPLRYVDVARGLAAEYRKLGRPFPVELREPASANGG